MSEARAPVREGTLALLHGFLGGPASFRVLDTESLGLGVYAPWLAGHGPAPRPARDFEAELEFLAEELAQKPAPRFLLGYSQGARLALGLLASRPELFERCALIGVQPGLRTAPERATRRQQEDAWIALLEDEGIEAFEAMWRALPLFGPAKAPEVERELREVRIGHRPAGLVGALLALGTAAMPSYWDALSEIHAPVELWVGERDEKFLLLAREMQTLLPRARVVSFPAAYHNPLLDAPDHARAALRSWLGADWPPP